MVRLPLALGTSGRVAAVLLLLAASAAAQKDGERPSPLTGKNTAGSRPTAPASRPAPPAPPATIEAENELHKQRLAQLDEYAKAKPDQAAVLARLRDKEMQRHAAAIERIEGRARGVDIPRKPIQAPASRPAGPAGPASRPADVAPKPPSGG